jgi:hypothetical protein
MPIDPARLVRLSDLTIPDVEPVDVTAFTAERATVAVDGFTRLEGLYCPACAPAQFDLMADRISCPTCQCPTEPGVALARRDAYAVLAGLNRLPVEDGVLIERGNTHMLELARHYFYRLPMIHDARDRALTWAYSRRGLELIIAVAKELHDNAVAAAPERPYQVRESTDS